MNCAVCGNPLPFDRVIFHCSCGAYVHGYCWDKHVLDAHRPDFEKGSVDLNGDFQVIEPVLSEVALDKQVGPILEEEEVEAQEPVEGQIHENIAEELQETAGEE